MPVQLTTKSVPFLEDSEIVVITRFARAGTDGLGRVSSQIYNGPGDFQINTGDTYTDPGGVVASADGVVVINAASVAALPAVKLEDVVVVNTVHYTVVLVQLWSFALPHLELLVRIGTSYKAAR